MSDTSRWRWLGITAYGALFAVGLPAALLLWARAAEPFVRLRAVNAPAAGIAIAVAGAMLMAASMISLWRQGGGLPMSPYPPPKRVAEGPYRWIEDPIYAGFVITCAGISIALGSAAGLYLVTPVVALAAAAFVLGYERDATRTRLGLPERKTILRLPDSSAASPSWEDRLSIYLLVLAPWLLVFEAIVYVGGAPDAISTWTSFDADIPLVPWTELLYASTYLLVPLVPMVARSRAVLRKFAVQGWLATLLVGSMQLLVPFVTPTREVTGDDPLSALMLWERAGHPAPPAFPAFHVVWALLGAEALSETWPRARWMMRAVALAMCASCLTTGMHSIADVAAGFVAFGLVARYERIWDLMRRGSEAIANSWREWRLGPARLMNHGIWAGCAIFAGLLMIVTMAGRGRLVPALAVTLAGVVGAALMAQLLEGSSQLLRPFGYFGSVAGVLVALAALATVDHSAIVLLGAVATAAPVIHVIGRGRCLVQGCCHGRQAADAIGIRYTHPRTRVVRLSGLGGVPIHNTPLYSMLWNLFIAAILIRFWTLEASAEALSGIYFLLAGLGRFVEEHFRGEPQTKIVAGLRVYQWFSIAFVAGGSILTVAGATPMPPAQSPSWGTIAAIAGFALFTTAAYGADLPNAEFRFSRLV